MSATLAICSWAKIVPWSSLGARPQLEIDVAVVGAGVTGLACAREIASRGRSVCVLERHRRPGTETSTHNSGVIHAGLYYRPESLKTRLCVEGRPLLYEFCRQFNVPHDRRGKLVVARSADEIPTVERLAAQARANGVEGLEIVDRAFIATREPAIAAVAALFSAETGIVDAEALVRALAAAAADAGAILLPGNAFVRGKPTTDGMLVTTDQESFAAAHVVNAAGLYADDVSRAMGGEAFTIYPCRGEYAELTPARRNLVNGLVYPVPEKSGHGLGVHLTPSIGGAVWIGPTTHYQSRKDDYEDDRLPVEAFVEPVQRLLPSVRPDDIRLSGSGIRPKLHPPDQAFADFMIRRDARQPRLVHAAGIESPGLTACLAVGRMVADLVEEGI